MKFNKQKLEIIKFLMTMVCESEKVGTVCKLCFMLMHVFGRIGVEWRNFTMDILTYRALLASNFIENSSLILISIEIMSGIILIQLRPYFIKTYGRHFQGLFFMWKDTSLLIQ